jgi:hypothetical protein
VRVVDREELGKYVDSLAGTTAMGLILEQLTYLFALDR